MTEAAFQTQFTKWARHNVTESSAFELKITSKDYISFDAVQPHQKDALMYAKNHGLGYKIPDVGLGKKPFDFFVLKGDAYVVVMFYKRGQKTFYMIDIEDWLSEETFGDRRSLTEARAIEIGLICKLA